MKFSRIASASLHDRFQHFFCVALLLTAVGGGPAVLAQAAADAPGGVPQVQKTTLPPVVARVNGDDISRTELLAQGQMMRYQAVQSGQPDPGAFPGFSNMVLDALISEHLVFLEMKSKGTLVSEEEIDREVASMAASYPDAATFDEALAKQQISSESLRYQLKKNLSIEKLLRLEIGPRIKVSEEALHAHYDRNIEKMKVPESRKVRHILMRIPALAGKGARGEVETRLLGLRQQVRDGADFEALAMEYSEDTLTREKGGSLPWIAITGKANIFEETVAALDNIGDVSEVIETELGLHIVQLSDRKAPRVRTFDEVREEMYEFLKTVEMRNEIRRRLEALRQGAKIEILI
jgi:peptidyl-prolyl cis-trans isomerase C